MPASLCASQLRRAERTADHAAMLRAAAARRQGALRRDPQARESALRDVQHLLGACALRLLQPALCVLTWHGAHVAAARDQRVAAVAAQLGAAG